MHNKHIGKLTTKIANELETLTLEQYGSTKAKDAYIQDLNTRLFYDLTRLKRIAGTSTFDDLVFNYNLVVHSITSLSMQRANISKEPIMCTFTTLQNMEHSAITAFGESTLHIEG